MPRINKEEPKEHATCNRLDLKHEDFDQLCPKISPGIDVDEVLLQLLPKGLTSSHVQQFYGTPKTNSK